MTNHTTAETWLRNAPAGERSVTDAEGTAWALQDSGTVMCLYSDGLTVARRCIELPPGTYTLNYREGMQLDAQEAWDYLAGGERRIARTDGGREYRIIAGSHVQIRDDSGEWVAPHWGNTLLEQSYTIAPDEPAIGKLQALGALADALPVDEEADNETTRRLNEQREERKTRKLERPCCREATRIADEALRGIKDANGKLETLRSVRTDLCKALGLGADATWGDVERRCVSVRERVAELERERDEGLAMQKALTGARIVKLNESSKRIADLEAKLAEAVVEAQNATDDYLRVIEERDAAIAERDEAKRSLTLWQNAYRTHFAPEYDETKHPNEWPEVARVTVERLRAEVERLSVFEGDGVVLTEVVGLLGLDNEAVSEDIYAAISELQQRTITLPTDTTTPLDLAQRAVALMGGRVVLATLVYYRLRDGWLESSTDFKEWGLCRETEWLWIVGKNAVTLAPEPEPARRKLTFGEAVEAVSADDELAFDADCDGETIQIGHDGEGVRFYSKEHWVDVGITPAMLAAEWEAVK